ncbi:MAG: xylulokinase [Roseburia sp.]|nr:xylulokinase [Roseburia sp.]
MKLFIGVDLGTSAVKLLLMDEKGVIRNVVSKEYPLEFPQPGWSQQDPEDWQKAVMEGIPELLRGFDGSDVAGIGCGGQMHGLVILDEYDNVIRHAILWNDGRTAKQVNYLNNEFGKEKLSELTANIAFAGFTAPKILWVKENEPDNFARIAKIMLPKDYVNYILTGVHACDYSDASGTLLLDVQRKCWSGEMLDVCGITENQMPKLFESYESIGSVKPEIAKLLGISENAKVAAGAGDNAAAAVGTGVVGEGGCNISLGTSGTVFISSEKFGVDRNNALHAFAHADGGYHLMGCMLSAASCNKWLMDEIYQTGDYAAEQAGINDDKLGRNHVYFLPYLMGERSPINDTNARGTFIGMTMDTTRADLTQAVLEGVAYAIRDCVEVARSLGIVINSSKICGGGAKSPLWKKIMANVLNVELECMESEQGPGMGGAMLAMVACGEYNSVQVVCGKFTHVASIVKPEPELVAKYEKHYQKFKKIYPANKSLFALLQARE